MDKEYSLVEYSKDFATSIGEYSAYELDVLLCLAYAARQAVDNSNVSTEEDLELELDTSMVKKNLKGNVTNKRIEEAILKIFDAKVFFKSEKYKEARHIFNRLTFDDDYKKIIFTLKKEYINLLFNLSGNFTRHEILEFTSLKGKYAKKIYQIIMSYKNIGKWEFKAEEFRKILDCPEKYRWSDIETKSMKNVREELIKNTNIKTVELEKIKSGRAITKVVLKWSFDSPEILSPMEKAFKGIEEVKPEESKKRLEISRDPLTPFEEQMVEIIEKATGEPRPFVPRNSSEYAWQMRYYIETMNEKQREEMKKEKQEGENDQKEKC